MRRHGFTLIELLIVVGIIAILAAAVVIAVNPGGQFAGARDATRELHINNLYNALLSYKISNGGNWGVLTNEITDNLTEICNTNLDSVPDCSGLGLVNLSILVDEGYINQIPVDYHAEEEGSGYEVARGISLLAPLAETRFIGIGMTQSENGESVIFCEHFEDYGTQGTVDGDPVYCDGNGNLWSPTLSGMADASDGSPASISWGCSGSIVGADSFSNGEHNTAQILSNCGEATIAARACDDLDYGEHTDWFLPAIDTLEDFYNEIGPLPDYDYNSISDNNYWSSTENSANTAWTFFFGTDSGYSSNGNGKNNTRRVRCVRR